jgi:hypothetical protein
MVEGAYTLTLASRNFSSLALPDSRSPHLPTRERSPPALPGARVRIPLVPFDKNPRPRCGLGYPGGTCQWTKSVLRAMPTSACPHPSNWASSLLPA